MSSSKFRRATGSQHAPNAPLVGAGLQGSVALLYQTVENLKDDFVDFAEATNQQIREVVRGQEKQFTEFKSEMRLIANDFATSRKPQWGLLLGLAALFLTVIGGGWTIIKLQTDNTVAPVVSYQRVMEAAVKSGAETTAHLADFSTKLRTDLDSNTARDEVSISERKKIAEEIKELRQDENNSKANQQVFVAKLAEVETQFRANDQSRNVQFAEQQRMNSIIMQLTKSGIVYPTAPYSFPAIASGPATPSP